jgi:hypothetical protein
VPLKSFFFDKNDRLRPEAVLICHIEIEKKGMLSDILRPYPK